jgi:hypothetical protein
MSYACGSVRGVFVQEKRGRTLRILGLFKTLNASWIYPESQFKSANGGENCIAMSPDGTGLGPTPSLLRKRLAEVYPGESPTPFAYMIGGLSCNKGWMSRENLGEGLYSLSSTLAVLDTARVLYGSGMSTASCNCCQ